MKFDISSYRYYIPSLLILILAIFTAQNYMSILPEYGGEQERLLHGFFYVMWFLTILLVFLNIDKIRRLKSINKEKKEALSLLENRLAAMEASHDGISIADKDGRLTYINEAFLKMIFINPEDISQYIGRHWAELYTPDSQEKIRKLLFSKIPETGCAKDEFIFHDPDDEALTSNIEIDIKALPDGGFIGTALDVTEKLQAGKEKEELQVQFFQAQKMEAIGRLAGGIAHDFNNILAAMNGYTEFLLEDLEKESPQYNFAKKILQAGEQARNLVDQMLAFSRTGESDFMSMDLVIPVRESLSMLSASLPKTLEVVTDIKHDTLPIYGNATQLSQVVMNLCVNAKDAMEEGHGRLEIALDIIDPKDLDLPDFLGADLPPKDGVPFIGIEDIGPAATRLIFSTLARDKKYACLSVTDTGSGMSRVIIELIFEPFFTTKPVDKGTGLGLAMVHGVLTGHQGALIVESTLQEGTCFKLFFPLSDEAIIEPAGQDKCADSNAKFARILLVEDQEDVRDVMICMLERMGFEALSCDTGLEALSVLRENPEAFDLVITDQNMPKMTGLELVQQISIENPDLPFILLSGYSQERLEEIMKEHSSIKVMLKKPVSRALLSQKIEKILSEG